MLPDTAKRPDDMQNTASATSRQEARPRRLTHHQRLCLFFICGLVLAAWMLTQRALMTLTLRSDTPGTFKIYWAGPGQAYSEKHSSAVWIQPRQSHYTLIVGNLQHIERLRIDPLDRASHVVIQRLVLRQTPFQTVHLTAAAAEKALRPLQQIKHLALRPGRC